MTDTLARAIRAHYADEARARQSRPDSPSRLYGPGLAELDPTLAGLSFGCGDPLPLADLAAGHRVLDVGCGAGVDVVLAARAVGHTGEVVGLDLTPEMLALARQNVKRLGLKHVRLIEGDLVDVDLPDRSFDRVLSNATLHLTGDLPGQLGRIRELLKDDGLLVLCDLAVTPRLPELITRHRLDVPGLLLHGSLPPLATYLEHLDEAGFESVELVHRATFDPRETLVSIATAGLGLDADARRALEVELAQVEFQVIHVVAQARVDRESVPALCSCGQDGVVELVSPLDSDRSPGLVRQFLAGRLNVSMCPRCGQDTAPLAPFMVIDHGRQRLVHVFPASSEAQRDGIEAQSRFFLARWMEATGRRGYESVVAFGIAAGRTLLR